MCSKKSQSKTIANSMIDILFRDMKNLSQLLKVFSKVESLLKEIQKTQDIKKQIKKFEEIIDILVGELKKDDKAWEEHKHSIDGFNKIINGTQKFDELQSQCEVTNNLLSISDDKVSVQP
jgi:negative regulator of replication initiation